MKAQLEPDLSGTITHLLGRMRGGDRAATEELFDVVYAELREIAHRLVGRSAPGSLEATELVHAACARLLGKCRLEAENRRHFFFLFGRAMRDVLTEQARRRAALKRGGSRQRVSLLEMKIDGATMTADILDLRAAVEALRGFDRDAARVVDLRFFADRSLEETAEILDLSVASVRRNWAYARAWLREHLAQAP